MNKEVEKGLVPKLRFSEFLNAGEWNEKPLGKIAEIITGNTPQTSDSDNYVGNKMFVSPADISDSRYIVKTKTTLSELGYSKTRHIPANSVLFVCIGSTIGKIAQNKFDCATNQQINSVVPFRNYSSDFLYFALDNDSSRIAELAGRHAVPIINKSSFSDVSINIPPEEKEQTKIAACLSSLDDLITAQTQKIAALKTHKKGLMQQLFPVEGETVPKLRFPEFRDSGEWKTDKLSNLISTVTPPQKLPTSLYQTEGLYPIIDQSQNYICGWTNDENALISNDLPLIIFGDHTCILKMVRVPFVQGADGIKIIKTNKQVEIGYLYQFLQFNSVVMEEYKRHFSILKEKIISFPTQESGEQQKIADCLSSLDELINAKIKKCDALKLHKKGLMQGLFPVVDDGENG